MFSHSDSVKLNKDHNVPINNIGERKLLYQICHNIEKVKRICMCYLQLYFMRIKTYTITERLKWARSGSFKMDIDSKCLLFQQFLV